MLIYYILYDHDDNTLSYNGWFSFSIQPPLSLAYIITDHGRHRAHRLIIFCGHWHEVSVSVLPKNEMRMFSKNLTPHLTSRKTLFLIFVSRFCDRFAAIMHSLAPGDCGESHLQVWHLNCLLCGHEPKLRGTGKEHCPYNWTAIANALSCIQPAWPYEDGENKVRLRRT